VLAAVGCTGESDDGSAGGGTGSEDAGDDGDGSATDGDDGTGSGSSGGDGGGSSTGDPGTGSTGGGGSGTDGGETDTGSGASDTGEPQPPAIGLIQYNGDRYFGEYDTNLANLEDWSLEAIDRGATIIVQPEGSTYGYASQTEVWCAPGMSSWYGRQCRDVSDVAEPIPGGATTTHWEAFATLHEVYVLYSLPEAAGQLFYNTLGVVGPDGYVTKYRKRALYYIDQAYAQPGQEAVVLQTPFGDFGLMLCLDGSYNGPYYDNYNALGVDAIIIPMDWDEDPYGPTSAAITFTNRAEDNDIVIYGADVSTWDGTAKYIPGQPRERNGLPPVAVGQDGVSVHVF
jgi:predicted amidohydrolase